MSDNKFIDSLKASFYILLGCAVVGGMFFILWSLIKIPMWLVSPYRGGEYTTRENVMMLSFDRIMWTPYSLRMILFSGWGIWFTVGLIYNILYVPSSPIWDDGVPWLFGMGPTGAIMIAFALFGIVPTIYWMILEWFMIFRFRNWVYWMVEEKGLRPI